MSVTSAERKFKRGLEQVAEICREVKDFESANAYELRTERNVRAGEIEYTCFAVEREATTIGHFSWATRPTISEQASTTLSTRRAEAPLTHNSR